MSEMMTDLKKLLVAARGCVCRDPLTCGHRDARLRLMYLAEAVTEELITSQEALAKAQQALAFTLLAAGAALTWADKKPVIRKVQAADAKARAALRLDGLTKAMQ